jgi:hypothetical protein
MENADWYSKKWSKCNQSTFDVVDFDIRTQNYTMSSSQNEGDQFGDDAIHCQMT